MKHYLVNITIWDPYEKTYEKRVSCTNPGLAAKRALEQARKLELKGRILPKVIHFRVAVL